MYTQTNNPIFPLFCWNDSTSFTYSFPNSKLKTAKIIKSSINNNIDPKRQQLNTQIVPLVTQIYSRFLKSLKHEEQKYIQSLSRNQQQYQQTKVQKALTYNKNRFQIFKREILNLMRTVDHTYNTCFKGKELFEQDYQTINALLFFIEKVYIEPSSVFPRSPQTETLFKWLVATIQIKSIKSNSKQSLIETIKLGDFQMILYKIDNILIESENISKYQTMLHLELMEQFKQRIRILNDKTLSNQEKQELKQSLQKAAKQKYELYKAKYMNCQTLKVFLLMSGNLKLIEQLSAKNWKTYIVLYIIFYNPNILPSQMFILIRKYIFTNKIRLSKSQVLQNILLNLDFYQAYKFTSQDLEPPIISTLGLMAYQFNLHKQYPTNPSKQPLDIQEDIIKDMFDWMCQSDIKWECKAPYLKKYVQNSKLKNKKQYLDIVIPILQYNIEEYFTIKDKNDYLRVHSYCKNIEELQLPISYQMSYIQSMMNFQIVDRSNIQYLFEMVVNYENKCGKTNLLDKFYELCMDALDSNRIDYKYLANFIASVPEFKIKDREKQKLFGQLFYDIFILNEAEKEENQEQSLGILKYLDGRLIDQRIADVLIKVHTEISHRFGHRDMKDLQGLMLEPVENKKCGVRFYKKI